MSKLVTITGLLVLGLAGLSCSPSSRNGNGNGDGGPGGDGGPTADAHDPNGSACAISQSKADKTPLDIFIMLDHSASMQDDNKWPSVTGAISSFIAQPSLAGVSVGMQYFGVPPSVPPPVCTVATCTIDSDCGSAACGPCDVIPDVGGFCEGYLGTIGGDSDSCVATDYATAAVPFATLPGVASAINASIAAHSPDGESTPTEPALAGAIQYAKAYATAHAGDVAVVVFATDGDPTGCSATNDIPHAQADAMAGATGTPKIATYVIGVGSDADNLDDIAVGGGTGSAFLVDTAGDANAQFLAAMNAIQHSALGCQYVIPQPTSGTLDFGEVNVVYTPGSGSAETIPNVANAAACPTTGNAWYYDNPAAPTQIILCGSTCTIVTADTMGEVDIALGCTTIVD